MDEIKERIRFREAKIRALEDPAIQELHAHADAAKTDFEKRKGLKIIPIVAHEIIMPKKIHVPGHHGEKRDEAHLPSPEQAEADPYRHAPAGQPIADQNERS